MLNSLLVLSKTLSQKGKLLIQIPKKYFEFVFSALQISEPLFPEAQNNENFFKKIPC